MKVIGIDLAGREENPTGLCVLNQDQIILKTLYYDKDLVNYVKSVKPSFIVIDAPLSLPRGRCCLEKDCKCAVGGHFREADREIRQYGRVLPLTFRGMKMLTLRGIELAQEFRRDFEVIESHPRTSQKMLKIKDIKGDLGSFLKITGNPTEHELDAALAAITGYLYLKGCYIELGDPEEGTIVIPKEGCEKFIE